MYKYSFEKLEVWNKARAFVSIIYDITEKFPKKEVFALGSQMERCAVSIMSNIAEGSSRQSPKEQLRFIEIAYGSLLENYNQLYVALDRKYIDQNLFDSSKLKIDEISVMLTALRQHHLKKLNS